MSSFVWSETLLLLWFLFLDTRAWPEGSYERGSTLLSVHLPYSLSVLLSVRKFSQNWLICFFLTLGMVLGAHIWLHVTEQDFFEKWMMSKMVKKGQKTRFFVLFKNIKSLILSAIGVNRKLLWSFKILGKLHAWEKCVSQVMAKNGFWRIRFQYSLIVNITLIDWYLTLIFGM